jgi:hypothetical protein
MYVSKMDVLDTKDGEVSQELIKKGNYEKWKKRVIQEAWYSLYRSFIKIIEETEEKNL